MKEQEVKVTAFGDIRNLMLQTILDLRSEKMDVSRGMAIAANFKVLNDNIQAEISATKVSIMTSGTVHDFGRVVSMGRRAINGEEHSLAIENNTR